MIKILAFIIIQFNAYSAGTSQVRITWTYKNFNLPIELFSVTPEKSKFISETRVVNTVKDAPVLKNLNGKLEANLNSSTPAVLIIKNDTAKDQYFFAVPHELNPHHASAGHYFECLCIGRIFKIPAHKVFYRIVRVNLNKTFSGLKKFEINHQVVGISETEALTTYKERIQGEN